MAQPDELSRRERQIMDAIYAKGEASAGDIEDTLADAPTRTTIRTLLRIMEDKGHLTHKKVGRAFVYRPVKQRRRVGQSALRGLLKTFFDGSLEKAVTAHLSDPTAKLDPHEIARLESLLRDAREKASQDAS